jgi:hypothetical protein
VIPLAAILVLAVGCFLAGWMARAENGRGARRASAAGTGAPPYDWAQDPDL